jgi:DNA invertase Pin-like site-specific DNA recombinase
MLIGYMRVSSGSDRQTTDLQRDALMAAGVDSRHLFEDHASGTKDDRFGLSGLVHRKGPLCRKFKLFDIIYN